MTSWAKVSHGIPVCPSYWRAKFFASSGSLSDYGNRDAFVKKLGETIPERSSALFMLFKRVNEDKVLPELAPYKPRVPRTSPS